MLPALTAKRYRATHIHMIGSHMPHWRSCQIPKSDGEDDKRFARGRSTPRWVKVFGIAALIVTALFVVVHLTSNGFGHHMHMSAVEYWTQRQ